jgi:hypothetical protein
MLRLRMEKIVSSIETVLRDLDVRTLRSWIRNALEEECMLDEKLEGERDHVF